MSEAAPHTKRSATLRERLRNLTVAAVLAAAIVGVFFMYNSRSQPPSAPQVASAPVKVISTSTEPDGVHVTARLDAPSPDGTSHQLRGVIPEQTWAQTKVVWACYPPAHPGQGILRTPLDPDCSVLGK